MYPSLRASPPSQGSPDKFMTVRGPGSPELYVKLPWGGVVVGCVSLENERRRIFFNFFFGGSRTALAVWALGRADHLLDDPPHFETRLSP